MSLVVLNTHQDLGNIERFKELPYELQNIIADYTEEGYNIKCYNYDWYLRFTRLESYCNFI